MPRELTTVDGTAYTFLAADHLRIKVEFAAPKHGTEMHILSIRRR